MIKPERASIFQDPLIIFFLIAAAIISTDLLIKTDEEKFEERQQAQHEEEQKRFVGPPTPPRIETYPIGFFAGGDGYDVYYIRDRATTECYFTIALHSSIPIDCVRAGIERRTTPLLLASENSQNRLRTELILKDGRVSLWHLRDTATDFCVKVTVTPAGSAYDFHPKSLEIKEINCAKTMLR